MPDSRKPYNSSIYQYFPDRGDFIFCIVCRYRYRKDCPLSTLRKHLRVKHSFSIKKPLSPTELQLAIDCANEARTRDTILLKPWNRVEVNRGQRVSHSNTYTVNYKLKLSNILNPIDEDPVSRMIDGLFFKNVDPFATNERKSSAILEHQPDHGISKEQFVIANGNERDCNFEALKSTPQLGSYDFSQVDGAFVVYSSSSGSPSFKSRLSNILSDDRYDPHM